MKRTYGKHRYTRSIVNGVRFWLILVVLVSSFGPMLVSADVVWSDNFDDGNYDGWTVYSGAFSAADGYLESTELEVPENIAGIYNESNVSTGTWSFDCYLPNEDDNYIGLSLLTDADFISYLFLQVTSERVVLWLNRSTGADYYDIYNWIDVAYWRSTFNNTWTHIDVTLTEDWLFDVFVNNIHRISYTNSTPVSSIRDNHNFFFNSHTLGEAIDNVVVSDTIDMQRNETTTTTTSPSPTDGEIDTTMILLVGGGVAAIVVIVLVVRKVRGR